MKANLNLLTFLLLLSTSTITKAWNAPSLSSPATDADTWVGATLNWNAVNNSQAYQLQVDTIDTFNSPLLFSVNKNYINSSSSNSDTQENPPNLRFGQRYYWRVRAWVPGDTSVWTQSTFVTRDYVTLSAPATGSDIWTGGIFNWAPHAGVLFYDIQADTTAAFNSPALVATTTNYINATDGNSDTQWQFNNLFFGKTYYWRVRARNAVDTSRWDDVRTVITRDYVNQTAPTSGNDTWTGVTLNWAPHTGVIFYDAQADTTSSFNSSALINITTNYVNSSDGNSDTQWPVENLYFGKTYFWRVRARNAVDTSRWDAVWTFNTRDYVNLSSPSSGNTTWTGMTMNWAPHNGIDFYDAQLDTSANFNSPILRQTSNAYVNSSDGNSDTQWYQEDLLFGKTYYWRVRARNAVDSSSWNSAWTFSTNDFVNLTTPAQGNLNTSLNPTMNWAPHNGIETYTLQVDVTNLFNSQGLLEYNKAYINSSDGNSDTQQSIGPLQPNTVYFWRVRAINANDTSLWNERWFSTGTATPQFPQAPTDLSPNCGSSGLSPTGINLAWASVSAATSYQVEFKAQNEEFTGTPNFQPGSATNFSLPQLSEGVQYCWRVRSLTGDIAGNWSEICCFSTAAQVSIAAPILEQPEVCQSSQLSLNYSTIGSFNPNNQFSVEISDANGNFNEGSTLLIFSSPQNGTQTLDIPLLPVGNGYRIRIRSSNPIFTGAPSAEFTINPLPELSGDLSGLACIQLESIQLNEILPLGGAYSGATVQGNQFFPPQAGVGTFIITYTYTDENGCSSSLLGDIFVDACTANQPVNQGLESFSILNQRIELHFKENNPSRVELIDLTGKSLQFQENGGSTCTMSLAGYPSGLYLLLWENSGKSGSLKVFVP